MIPIKYKLIFTHCRHMVGLKIDQRMKIKLFMKFIPYGKLSIRSDSQEDCLFSFSVVKAIWQMKENVEKFEN